MRRYLQTLGRALYARAKGQSKPVVTPTADPNIVPSPLPAPKQETKPPLLCESLTDLIKWHCIRIALKSMERGTDAAIRRDMSHTSLPVNVKALLSPQDVQLSCKATFNKNSEIDELQETRGDQKHPFQGSTFDQLFTTTVRDSYMPNNKVTVVGASDVGMATVFSLLTKGVTNDISMIDFSEDKLKGELMDFQAGSKFLRHARLRASKDYAISADSKVCILTPCSETASGDKNYDCARCNVEVLKAVVPQLLSYSPDCVLLVALDPVDVLTYLAWRVSDLPKGRVVGSGTNLSSATFRYLLSDRLGLAPSACSGYIIGENGESSVPVWSGVTAGGVLLRELNPDIGTEQDPENWQEVHQQLLQSGQEIRDLKGYNTWASALSITDICAAILNDANSVRPLSTYVKGEHNIEEEVFMSLPCVVGGSGVTDIIRQPLTQHEMELLHKSAQVVAEKLGTIKIAQ